MLPISNVIRKLRRDRDITQEELAVAVGVTYQSVSRWENGQAYPDIELIPKIAQYFDISTDVLFGTDTETIDKRLEMHYQKIKEVQANPEEFYQACKVAYDEFPKEFTFGLWLCRCYVFNSIRPHGEHRDEIRNICQNIIDNCTNEDFRIEAMEIIAIAEDDDHLDKWLKLMPSWKSCKEILLETRYGYHDDLEKFRLQRQENFISFIGYVFYNCSHKEDNPYDIIATYKMILVMIDMMRNPNTNIDAWIEMRANFYMRLARAYFRLKESDIGYIDLEKSIDLYLKYAELPLDTILSYNCPTLNVLTENKISKPEDDKEDKGKYLCWWVYHDLTNDSIFSSLKGEKRFDALIEKLAPYYY